MSHASTIALLFAALLLGGCASRDACQDGQCERADPDLRTLVIWWAPGMRNGLGSEEQPMDHSIVPLGE